MRSLWVTMRCVVALSLWVDPLDSSVPQPDRSHCAWLLPFPSWGVSRVKLGGST
jgi:hypothetical protein